MSDNRPDKDLRSRNARVKRRAVTAIGFPRGLWTFNPEQREFWEKVEEASWTELEPLTAQIAAEVEKASGQDEDPVSARLGFLKWFIPRAIREPFFGDLLEDISDMRRNGVSVRAQWTAVFFQVLALIVRLPLTRWLRGGQISK